MKVFDSVMNSIKEHAKGIYPKELFSQYQNLEKSYLEKNEADKKTAASNIAEIKSSLKKRKININWEMFFESLIEKVEKGEDIPIKDIVTVEYAPSEMSQYLLRLAGSVAKRRNAVDDEKIRLCKSIYGFTTCVEPCGYGSYGSCLFASRENNESSIAEKMFGNITTTEEYLKEIKAASQYATNLKLITTSHRASSDVLEVVLNSVKKTREDKEVRDFPICISIGSMDEEQIIMAREAGVTRINHNLETSYYNALYLSTISNNSDACDKETADSAHEYRRRLTTLTSALQNKIGVCSGGMFFYGDDEIAEDRILLYLTFKELDKIYKNNSSPFNVYVPLKNIIDESVGWFNAFALPCVNRENTIDSFTIFKTLVTFSLVVHANHKIVISAGSKWIGDEYYSLAVELGGGAGLKSYLQQMDSEKSIEIAQKINSKYSTCAVCP
jgi:biotin synthase